jgi:hypothetical protein
MSRSKRKTPVRGMSSSESEKADKQASHRKLRRVARVAVEQGEPVLPLEKELTNTWSMDKDGKRRFDPVAQPRLMRK